MPKRRKELIRRWFENIVREFGDTECMSNTNNASEGSGELDSEAFLVQCQVIGERLRTLDPELFRLVVELLGRVVGEKKSEDLPRMHEKHFLP